MEGADEERRLRAALLRDDRVILLLDADAFYAQVEAQRLGVDLKTTPLAVRQWDGLIAVSYSARAAGVTRLMRAQEAQRLCPTLQLPHVEVLDAQGVPDPDPAAAKKATHKASLHRYRLASARIFKLLVRICGERAVEKGSIDEAYLDVSPMVDALLAGGPPWAPREAGAGGGAPASPARGRKRARAEDGGGGSGGGEDGVPSPLLPLSAEQGASLLAALDAVGGTCWLVPPGCGEPSADARGGGGGGGGGWHGLDPASPFDLRLAAGALCAAFIRARVFAELGFTLSAGAAIGSKSLAKLVAGRHKPDSMTLLPHGSVAGLLAATPLTRIRGLGAKLGAALVAEVERLQGGCGGGCGREEPRLQGGCGGGCGREEPEGEGGAREAAGGRKEEERGGGAACEEGAEEAEEGEAEEEEGGEEGAGRGAGAAPGAAGSAPPTPTLGAAQAIPLARLRAVFGDEAGISLFRTVRGFDDAPVKPRTQPKSLLCAKSMAPAACATVAAAGGWIAMNCAELALRLEADAADWERHPRKLVLHYASASGASGTKTGDMPPPRLSREALTRAAVALLDKALLPCTHLAVGASDFASTAGMQSLGAMFARQRASAAPPPAQPAPPAPLAAPPPPAAKKAGAMHAFLLRGAAAGLFAGEKPPSATTASGGAGRKKTAAGPLAALFSKQHAAASEVVVLDEE
jgi:nucleotidyltransferase/DNA polymerase involved in DNA repair